MKDESLAFVKFNFSHEKNIAGILNDLWGFGENLKRQKIADGFGKAYLNFCLSQADYAYTILLENQAVAFLCWNEGAKNKNTKKEKINFFKKKFYFFRALHFLIPILFTKEFHYQVKAWQAFLAHTAEQEKELPHSYDAQLLLFINDSKVRGRGLGKKMLNFFEEKLRAHQMSSYFLHTDTECSYAFYDKCGLKRILSKSLSEKNGSMQENWQIFVYANEE